MQRYEATLEDILKGTSRAFYLSLAVLPFRARGPLSLAYLIARAADTIADTDADDNVDRQALLENLKAGLDSPEAWVHGSEIPPGLHPEGKERHLIRALSNLLRLLQDEPTEQREAIRQVVATLIGGMLWDQSLFPPSPSPEIRESGLDDSQLERYTYLVAGCVGPFWSKVCALSESYLSHLASPELEELAIEFGKGLQWVNILRDIPKDQQSGRYYMPELHSKTFNQRFCRGSHRALQALGTACRYPLLFPCTSLRHRLGVFWPLVLGFRTLEKLFHSGGPRPDCRVKVPRWEVLAWVAIGPFLVINDSLLSLTLTKLGRRAQLALALLEEPHEEISK